MNIAIHQAGLREGQQQKCKRCGFVLIDFDKIDEKKFAVRPRVQSVKNTTTKFPSMVKGEWVEDISVKVSTDKNGNMIKAEYSKEEPTCKSH